MAEMYGKVQGCSRGRGGSMHLFDAATPLLWRQCHRRRRVAAGGWAGAGGQTRAGTQVTACFFGEGAVAEGEFHESMNLAALWKLPVLFCCENNLYAMGTALARSESETDIRLKAAAFEIPAWPVDGMDVVAVEDAATRAADCRARRWRTAFLGVSHLPLPRPLDVRSRALSRQARSRGVEKT